MEHAIITPVNQRLVHLLADELTFAPSHRRRLDHIYAIKVLPARAEDRAERGSRAPRAPRTACAARADAHTAARLPRATQTAYTTYESVPAPPLSS